MKKPLLVIVLVALVIPSIAFAQWWNPFSWFSNWTFKKVEHQSQILENATKELEQDIESVVVEEDAKDNTLQEEKSKESSLNKVDNTSLLNGIQKEIPTSITNQSSLVTSKKIDPSEVRCEINTKKDIKRGDSFTAKLRALTLGISQYDVFWDKKHLTRLIDFNEAVFTINNIGDNKVFATVVRKNDGATGVVTCLDIFISCDEYSCLSDVDKKIYKLQTIINEVDSWYNDDYPNLSPVDRCYISESIIRALEYEYTLMGGTNLPVFSKTADCANSVSPQAYKYKIQLLIDTI